jgi:hypothetical protein
MVGGRSVSRRATGDRSRASTSVPTADRHAYLWFENQVVPRTAVMNAQTFPKVELPARLHFVPDDQTGGDRFR